MTPRLILVAALIFTSLSQPGSAQRGSLPSLAAKPKQYITYVADEQTIAAGKKTMVELSFHVADGYHVNSHTPKSELLIPTSLTLQPATGVKVEAVQYPSGTAYSFSFEPNEKLDVYTGVFLVRVPITASAGSYTLAGVLHYQACDNAACYPPKSLPVEVAVTAK